MKLREEVILRGRDKTLYGAVYSIALQSWQLALKGGFSDVYIVLLYLARFILPALMTPPIDKKGFTSAHLSHYFNRLTRYLVAEELHKTL